MEMCALLLPLLICMAFISKPSSANPPCPTCPMERHPQDLFCEADFVIKATVTDVTDFADDPLTPEVDPQRRYKVYVEKVYKGNVTKKCYQYLWTPLDDPCGWTCTIGAKYLMSGYEEEGDLRVDKCGLKIPWEDVTRHQKKGINKRYPKNCQCQAGDDRCTLDPAFLKECYFKYATCEEYAKSGCAPECKWRTTARSFKKCCKNSP